jgi:hypothetical protein
MDQTPTATVDRDAVETHYLQLLTAAPVLVPLDATDLDVLEVCNTEIGDTAECFELGPFDGNRWLRIRCADAQVLSARLIRLADDLSEQVYAEREAKVEAERHECIGCRTRIDAEVPHCGAFSCRRRWEQEQAYESLGLL